MSKKGLVMTKIRMPEEVRDIELAFGGDMKKLLPPMEEIPGLYLLSV